MLYQSLIAHARRNRYNQMVSVEAEHLVLILDDEEGVRLSLAELLGECGYETCLHASPESLYASEEPGVPACLVLDLNLNRHGSGLDVHKELVRMGWALPVIFLTGDWNIDHVKTAIRNGADDFLTKPVRKEALLEGVRKALEHSALLRRQRRAESEAGCRVKRLTPREHEVLRLVFNGRPNKLIAADLGIALVTVKVHRGRVMKKLKAANVAELVRIARDAGLAG